MDIRKIIFIIFIALAVGYFFYEAGGVLFAPKLEITEPKNGVLFKTTRVQISGRSEPKTTVWVAGREFITDEKGFFQGEISLDPGYNELGIKVKNRFGKETRKMLQLVVE